MVTQPDSKIGHLLITKALHPARITPIPLQEDKVILSNKVFLFPLLLFHFLGG